MDRKRRAAITLSYFQLDKSWAPDNESIIRVLEIEKGADKVENVVMGSSF